MLRQTSKAQKGREKVDEVKDKKYHSCMRMEVDKWVISIVWVSITKLEPRLRYWIGHYVGMLSML